MKQKALAAADTGQVQKDSNCVDILHVEVLQPKERVETIIVYGFVHQRLGMLAGFTLSCTVYWQADDYNLDSGDEHAHRYFSNLVRNHVETEFSNPDASLEFTLTDPELYEPIGFGSGYLKIQGALLN